MGGKGWEVWRVFIGVFLEFLLSVEAVNETSFESQEVEHILNYAITMLCWFPTVLRLQ